MSAINAIIRRELSSYFATPIAYVFIVIFLIMSGVFAFFALNVIGLVRHMRISQQEPVWCTQL